jgi:hypothetical protein
VRDVLKSDGAIAAHFPPHFDRVGSRCHSVSRTSERVTTRRVPQSEARLAAKSLRALLSGRSRRPARQARPRAIPPPGFWTSRLRS